MAHVVVIYNNVPDRSLLAQDLKSELGLLQVADGVAANEKEKRSKTKN